MKKLNKDNKTIITVNEDEYSLSDVVHQMECTKSQWRKGGSDEP